MTGSALGAVLAPFLAASVWMLDDGVSWIDLAVTIVTGSMLGAVIGYWRARRRGAEMPPGSGLRRTAILVGIAIVGSVFGSLFVFLVVLFRAENPP